MLQNKYAYITVKMNLKYLRGKLSMDYILAKNLLDLRDKIIRADKYAIIVFDERRNK